MNKLNFPDSLTNYPLTIEGIKLLQDAIALASSGVLTGASSDGCFIVSGCTESNDKKTVEKGTLLINGEIFSFGGGATATYIQVSSVPEAVTVGQVGYDNARTIKTVSFTDYKGADPYYEWAKFVRIQTNVDISNLINNNGITPSNTTNFLLPRYSIILWWQHDYGTPIIPYGYAFCDGYYYNPTNSTERCKDPNDRCTFQTPNLCGRFVVGYSSSDTGSNRYESEGWWDTNYSKIGHIGGEKAHSLRDYEMPPHRHQISGYPNSAKYEKEAWQNELGMVEQYSTGTRFRDTSYTGGNGSNAEPHENRPPYYVLAYIMKIH